MCSSITDATPQPRATGAEDASGPQSDLPDRPAGWTRAHGADQQTGLSSRQKQGEHEAVSSIVSVPCVTTSPRRRALDHAGARRAMRTVFGVTCGMASGRPSLSKSVMRAGRDLRDEVFSGRERDGRSESADRSASR